MTDWMDDPKDVAGAFCDAFGHGRLRGLFNHPFNSVEYPNREMQHHYAQGYRDGKRHFDKHGQPTMPALLERA